MLTKKEKQFFGTTTWGASELSICSPKQGAILINGHQIASYGFNKKIIINEKWEISAIYDAIFGARNTNISNFILFSTYFPLIDDIKLIVSVGIYSIYFFGDAIDKETVIFVNKLKEVSIPLEMINLK